MASIRISVETLTSRLVVHTACACVHCCVMLILGFVLVQEFAFGMDVLLRGTPAQKCAFMFDVFDENGDEVLTPEDLLRVLSHPGCLFAATKGRIPATEPIQHSAEHSQFAHDLVGMFSVGETVAHIESYDGSLDR